MKDHEISANQKRRHQKWIDEKNLPRCSEQPDRKLPMEQANREHREKVHARLIDAYRLRLGVAP